MLLQWLMITGGFALLFLGGESLVRGSVGLSTRMRISPLVVGLTVIAFGTSAPELVVSVRAAIQSIGGIAVGNVIGSNIMNIALILGLCATIYPLKFSERVTRYDLPFLGGTTVVLFIFLRDGSLSRMEGLLLFSGLLAYTFINIFTARSKTSTMAEKLYEEELGKAIPSSWGASFLILIGFVFLYYGSEFLVNGAVSVATALGISKAMIGLTVVALGTSLPEFITSLIATIKKEADLAIGTIVGSCIFNILSILGLASMIRPVIAQDITWVDVAYLLLVSFSLIPMAIFVRRLNRVEGLLLFISYGVYLVWLIH